MLLLQIPPTLPGEMIPMLGMVTGIVSMVVIGFVVVRLAQSQVGQAIARRISKGAAGGDAELHEEVSGLREQVGLLEQRLAETEERLDFAERLLPRGKDGAPTHG